MNRLADSMFLHVLLTTECDLKCRYCYGQSCDDIESDFKFRIDYSLPKTVNYDVDLLTAFCQRDLDCGVSFYGGEPMLCLREMREIMDKVEAKYFLVQTNGLHLGELEPEYTNRLETIFVSIDGNEKLTDYYRGVGVYRRVIDNLQTIVRNGFQGEIVARMTVMEETDVEKQVKWLLQNEDFSFSSIHWQLNAGFWRSDFAKRQVERWVKESYNPGVKRLVKFWVDNMVRNGRVLKIYPFLGLMNSLLQGEKSLLRCGSGWANYSILTDGTVVPCPIMGGMKDFYLGHIAYSKPSELQKILVSKPCTECKIISECGGRCLYANITKSWSEEAYSIVCAAVENIVNTLKREKPLVEQLMAQGKVQLEDFSHTKYNGCEVIP